MNMKAKRQLKAKWQAWRRDESGNVAIITAILLVVLIGFVALVVDVGHVKAVRNELQNAADAAALAGTRAYFPPVSTDTNLIPLSDPPYCNIGVDMATKTINRSDTQDLSISQTDVQTGTWDWFGNTFTANNFCDFNINAMRVTVRKDSSSANLPVATWFARIFGINTVDVAARATAAVGYLKGPGPGPWPPIWIPRVVWEKIDASSNPYDVYAYPDPGDYFGWGAPPSVSANAQYFMDAIAGNNIPKPIVGDVVNLSNGLVGSVHQAIDAAIRTNSTTIDYGNGDIVEGWLTAIMVGERTTDPNSTQMNQQGTVEEINPIVITRVLRPNQTEGNQWAIEFRRVPLDYNFVWQGGQSGGPISQIFATQPRLVGQAGQQY